MNQIYKYKHDSTVDLYRKRRYMKNLLYFVFLCMVLCFYQLDNNYDIVHSVLGFMASEG